MYPKLFKAFLLLIIIVFSYSCRHDAIIPDDNFYKTNCDTLNVTYANFVSTYMLEKSCILCHSDDMGYTPYLDNHDSISQYISDSLHQIIFIEKIESNHKIVDTLRFNTPCETAKLRNWIRNGAL